MVVPKVLFLCHGRLHLRCIPWLPFLQTDRGQRLWRKATYLDKDPETLPHVVADIATASSNLFAACTFDIIIAANCPITLYFEDNEYSIVARNFWCNVATWLKPGGFYVNCMPLNFLRPIKMQQGHEHKRKQAKKQTDSVREKKRPFWLGRFKADTPDYSSNHREMSTMVAHSLMYGFLSSSSDYHRLRKEATRHNPVYRKFVDWFIAQDLEPVNHQNRQKHHDESWRFGELHKGFSRKLKGILEQINGLIADRSKFIAVDSEEFQIECDRVICFQKQIDR